MRIPDSRIEAALEFRAKNWARVAELQAEWERLDNMRHSVRATLMLHSGEKSVGAQEASAYASDRYKEHLTKTKEARMDFLELRGKMQHEADVINVWRTASRNAREGVVT